MMQMKTELEAMADRMFDNDLLDKVLAAYKQEMRGDGIDIAEREYDEGTRALAAALTQEQKRSLSEMESLYADNAKYALQFGFTRGVYVGFQQFFVKDTTKQPFEKYVADPILKQPQTSCYGEYSNRQIKLNEICTMLKEQLDEANGEHLISVCCGWEERLNGVLRHAFYMGYRYAISMIEEVEPLGTYQMIEKTLMTEYEIGFISTTEERERCREAQARKDSDAPRF